MTPSSAGSGWVLGARYRVIDRLGSGGMAEVFRAHDEMLSRDVAVKVFRDQSAAPDSPGGVEREQTELRALAQLNHPNLITLYDGSIADADGKTYLVMELVEGPSLAARLRSGPLSEREACEVGAQVADALAYVHANGMVHRDVKPANILLGNDASNGDGTIRARLSDFGIVRLLDNEHVTRADLTVGTASYLAPEQARGSGVGHPADVYSLGLVLIESLSGERSFDGPPLEAMLARLSRDPAIPPDLPQPWPTLLPAMTAQDPAARPTAAQVATTLRTGDTSVLAAAGAPTAAALAGAAVPAVADLADAPTAAIAAPAAMPAEYPDVPADPPRRRRHLAGFLVAALVVLAALGVGSVLLLTGRGTPAAPGDPHQVNAPNTVSSSGTHRSQHNIPVKDTRSTSVGGVGGAVQTGPANSGANGTPSPSTSASTSDSTSAAPSTSQSSNSTSSTPTQSSSSASSSSSAPTSSPPPPTSSPTSTSSTPTSASTGQPTGGLAGPTGVD